MGHYPTTHRGARQERPRIFLVGGSPNLLKLLLGAQLVGVSALLLAAVLGARGQACVALAADFPLAVEGLGKCRKRRIVDTTAEAEHQVERGLLLDVVVRQRATVLQLLTRAH